LYRKRAEEFLSVNLSIRIAPFLIILGVKKLKFSFYLAYLRVYLAYIIFFK